MSARVLVDWRGHRRWWGRRYYGAGSRFNVATAEAVAAELRGRGHVARVVVDGVAPVDTGPLQIDLFQGNGQT